MKNFSLKVNLGERTYPILISENPDAETFLAPYLSGRSALLAADSSTEKFSGEIFRIMKKHAVCAGRSIFPAGEHSKNFQSVEKICRDAVAAGLDRSGVMIAFGGGVCGDMTGFAASIFMRGTRFIQIPTTLLAMADSSIGGKTGADLPEGKNLIGTFFQPEAVLMNLNYLRTLPQRELSCGFAEIIKTAMIADEGFFSFLEENMKELFLLRDMEKAAYALRRCCECKAAVVAEDEKEKGLRAILNYGHTFGHALEALTGYETFSHGEGVAIGMCMACDLSIRRGILPAEAGQRLDSLLKLAHLPLKAGVKLETDDFLKSMKHDKKSKNGSIRLILCDRIGHAGTYDTIPEEEIRETVRGRL